LSGSFGGKKNINNLFEGSAAAVSVMLFLEII